MPLRVRRSVNPLQGRMSLALHLEPTDSCKVAFVNIDAMGDPIAFKRLLQSTINSLKAVMTRLNDSEPSQLGNEDEAALDTGKET